MAYVEVCKSGRLVSYSRADEQKARKGCKVRLGPAGEARITIGRFIAEIDTPKSADFGEARFTVLVPSHRQADVAKISLANEVEVPGKALVNNKNGVRFHILPNRVLTIRLTRRHLKEPSS